MKAVKRVVVVSAIATAMLCGQSGPSLPHDPPPNISWWQMPSYVFLRLVQEIYGGMVGF